MNDIHSTVIIEGDVKIGKNNVIKPYCVLTGPLEIGDDNIIGPHVVIGTPGEDTRNPRHDSSNAFIKIGNRNIIREFTAVQKPCYDVITEIKNDVFLMHGVHVPHDAILEDKSSVTPYVVIGGIVRVMEGANLGMACTINQRVVVGQYSIVATNAAAMKNVKPFSRYIPGKPISVNSYAIEKYGFKDQAEEISEYVLNNVRPKDAKLLQMIERFESECSKYGLATY